MSYEYGRSGVYGGPLFPLWVPEEEAALYLKTSTDGGGIAGLYFYDSDSGEWLLQNSRMFPIGAIYTSIDSTNPATTLGFGTWSSFGAGRVLVGFDSGDSSFDSVEETGGEKTHTLTATEMPAHTHDEFAPTSSSGGSVRFSTDTNASGNTDSTLNTGSSGSGGAHNNLQPYIVVYFWKREA